MPANDSQTAAIDSEIAHLRGLDLDGLRARWRSLTGRTAPPHLSKTLLLRVLAYRVTESMTLVRDRDRAKLSAGKAAVLGHDRKREFARTAWLDQAHERRSYRLER
jgi:hypothetical protein